MLLCDGDTWKLTNVSCHSSLTTEWVTRERHLWKCGFLYGFPKGEHDLNHHHVWLFDFSNKETEVHIKGHTANARKTQACPHKYLYCSLLCWPNTFKINYFSWFNWSSFLQTDSQVSTFTWRGVLSKVTSEKF